MPIESVIGLEIHVQLNTASKVFCGDSTVFGAEPNTQVSAISFALPGTLPRLNRKAVEAAARLGFALGCSVPNESRFDRKNYFYTDLPKAYQITQDAKPVCIGGGIFIKDAAGKRKWVRIHHIHLEEDAGKSIHDQNETDSLIDLNRAGVPLLEIVTEPDLRSADEAAQMMEEIRRLVRWLDISDGNMDEGSMRCDVNVSVWKPSEDAEFGNRCEIKNVNSMRFARKAIEFEITRQTALLEAGGVVVQQTRGFDPNTGETCAQRDKEDAHDYRYFPDPDLPPVCFSNQQLADLKAAIPPLPQALEIEFIEKYGLSEQDAALLSQDLDTALFYLYLTEKADKSQYNPLAFLLSNKLRPWAAEQGILLSDVPISAAQFIEFLDLISSNTVSNSVAYQKLLPALLDAPTARPADLSKTLNLVQNSDSEAIKVQVEAIIERFPDKVAAYKKGKKGLIGFFMGELMKASRGKADPTVAKPIFEELLDA